MLTRDRVLKDRVCGAGGEGGGGTAAGNAPANLNQIAHVLGVDNWPKPVPKSRT